MTTPNPSEREKTTAEINQAIAKALNHPTDVCEACGSKLRTAQSAGVSFEEWSAFREGLLYCEDCHCGRDGVKPFVTDANTRPEMLAALSYVEKRDLVSRHLNVSPNEKMIGLSDCVTILELDQPAFAKLFCKIKGLI